MKQKSLIVFALIGLVILQLTILPGCKNTARNRETSSEENDRYDGPEEIARMEWKRTMDPATRTVPRDRLMTALDQTMESKLNAPLAISAYGNWTERGPNSDVVGPSNGNTRANSGITSGRIRAILVDAADVTGNTVWVGGVNGGLWKTTNITASPATWTLTNDFFANMAITGICQNPASTSTMYFCTGEWAFNVDAVAGDGIFKSTNGGTTWTQLSSTTSATFDYCSKILCDASGNVYVTTRSGIHRSTDGGTTWTAITPSGLSTSRFSDMELSSTGRLHVSAGQFSTCAYRYTDNPSTVAAGTWTSPTAGYPTSNVRIELGCSGNTLYALPSGNANPYQVATIYKSTNGGANWAATTGQPTAGWAGGQAWYSLGIDVDPANGNIAVVGGLEPYRTTDGGATWTKLANWVGTTGQYVHADIHFIKIYGTSSLRMLFGCDGGIHFSSDAGTTIRDRNQGLRLKQFYSVAAHPTTTNHFIAGAQDNGVHMLTSAGLGSSTEVIGGDGAFSAIDQDQGQYQFSAYVYNRYRRSTNTGSTWGSVSFFKGTSGAPSDFGDFINPWDYDNTANIIYGGADADEFFRWTTPQTTATGNYYSMTTFGTANAAIVPLTNLGGGFVSTVKVSPYTANRVYFGADNGRVVYLDGANTAARPGGIEAAGTNITGAGFPAGTVSCVATGTNDNNLMVSFANYGVSNIWVTTNGGTSWTAIDGNLPDMPVRWCIFKPGDNTRAIIATETGVWLTQLINGASTVWVASPSFPTVRVDMLAYRASDGLIAAATHGRGLWTQPLLSVLPLNNFTLRGRWTSSVTAELVWDFQETNTGGSFTPEYSLDGQNYTAAGNVTVNASTNYKYNHQPSASSLFYRIKHTSSTGKVLYSNVVKLNRAGGSATDLQITQLFPNPVKSELKLAFVSPGGGKTVYAITNMAGQQVWRKDEENLYTGSYIKTWDISRLPNGNYVFTVMNGNKRVSQKFVKQ